MYNGHENWDFWNVALWLFNDEGLYRMMVAIVEESNCMSDAAQAILDSTPDQTPDGAPYTFDSIAAAIEDWEG